MSRTMALLGLMGWLLAAAMGVVAWIQYTEVQSTKVALETSRTETKVERQRMNAVAEAISQLQALPDSVSAESPPEFHR